MKPWTTRTVIRAILAGLLAAGAALTTALVDNSIEPVEIVTVVMAGLTALGGWFGIGAASENVEPFFGKTSDAPVDIPSPPGADPEPA